MDASAQSTATALQRWYKRNARVLPWRSPPGVSAPPPYRVWLSEVMLQQTTVAAVIPRYTSWIARWPTVLDLASAGDDEIMAAWAGLGYYARARNLIACAREVAGRGGEFSSSEAGLRKLPGVGAYTAAAVAAIAFGERAAVVDANVERVVARLFAISKPLPLAKVEIRERMEALTPSGHPGDFAQAMMDLGATVCTPRQPDCPSCPLTQQCRGQGEGAERFPVKPPKKSKVLRQGRAYWIERDGRVWLVRRQAKGMLGGMRALPDDGWGARSDGHSQSPVAGGWEDGGSVRHSFTHFDLDLQLMLHSGSDLDRLELLQGEWWPLDRIGEAGLPTLFAKAVRLKLRGE